MALMDRGVSTIAISTLHTVLNYWVAPVELIMFMLWFFAYFVTGHTKQYQRFPSSVYRWIMLLEMMYSFFVGPLRWLPGNAWYESTAHPTTPSGCRNAVFLDTFYHTGVLFTNTIIVSGVFYQIYFDEVWHLSLQRQAYSLLNKLFWCVTLGVTFYTVSYGDQHNYVGWCIADSHSVIMKILAWFLFMVLQIIMIIPTQMVYYQNKKASTEKKSNVGNGTFLRYVVVMVTQVVGLFPMLSIEFMGLTRRAIPDALHWIVVLFMPVCHFVNFLFITMRIWPKFFTAMNMPNPCVFMEGLMDAEGSYDMEIEEDNSDSKSSDSFSSLSANSSTELSDLSSAHSDDSNNQGKGKKSTNCLDRIPFWLHLVLTIIVPFVLLVIVSILMIVNTDVTNKKADRIRKDIILTSRMSDYVHESQKERGNTGVYMGSMGGRFRCEIQAQYDLTDIYKSILQTYLDQEFDNVKLVTKTTFLKALIKTMELDTHRAQVFELSIPKSTGLAYYNDMNMFFVGVLGEVCKASKIGNPIQHLMFSNMAFFSGKEKIGIERAVTSVAYGLGGWANTAAFRKFVDLLAAQETHLYFYNVYVSDANLAFYNGLMEDPVVAETGRMEIIAGSNNRTLMGAEDSAHWFNQITAKINLIRKTEADMATQLTTESRKTVIDSAAGMAGVVLTLAVVLIIDGLMILGLARTSRDLKRFESNERYRNDKGKSRENVCLHFIHWFQSISFVWQVLAPVIMCGIGLMGISWILMSEQVDESQIAAETWENMNLQFFMSNFIHETQKERGATGVHMGKATKGDHSFMPNLIAQRTLCDTYRALFLQFIEEYIDYQQIKELDSYIQLMDMESNLNTLRYNVTFFNVTGINAPTALGFYTTMNRQMVIMSNFMVKKSAGNSIEANLLSYIGYFFMKEKAGNERAVGAGTFPAGFSTSGTFKTFVKLVSLQETAYDYFLYFGQPHHLTAFDALRETKEWRTCDLWRSYLLNWDLDDAKSLADIKTVFAPHWYGNMTAKIDMWRDVEMIIVKDLNSYFNEVDEQSESRTILLIVMLAIVFVVSCIVLYRGFKIILAANSYQTYRRMLQSQREELKKSLGDMKGVQGSDGSTFVSTKGKSA